MAGEYSEVQALKKYASELLNEVKRISNKERMNTRMIILTSAVSAMLLLAVFLAVLHYQDAATASLKSIHEEISYLHSKDSFLEKNVYLVAGYQQNLSMRMQDFEAFPADAPTPSLEQPSPFDHIKREQIQFESDRFVIKDGNFRWSYFEDTGSMVPTIGHNADGIEIIPKDVNDIHVGDIISYEIGNETIIHRVVRLGYDSNGWYATTKADSFKKEDPFKIRFGQIRGILVGIIY
ncbi:MAG: hypothetical protein ABIF10_03305 [Candidatus Woesearchaeota archaeon]